MNEDYNPGATAEKEPTSTDQSGEWGDMDKVPNPLFNPNPEGSEAATTTADTDKIINFPGAAHEGSPDDTPEDAADPLEAPEAAQETTGETEKSRAESRLEAVRARLESIERQLHEENTNKERLEEEVLACESALEANQEQHDQLTDKVDQLKIEVKKTKRGAITGFMNGLKIAKNLALGRHEEARQLLADISGNIDKNEAAMTEHAETESALEANEAEKLTLDDAYATALDERQASSSKISRLERQKADALKQIDLLKEEVANEAWSEAWKDAQVGIMREMGTNDMPGFRKELNAQKEALSEELEGDLAELDAYRNPSKIDRLMRSEEELARDAERADAVEGKLREEYAGSVSAIDTKLNKVDQYFPTWQERVKSISENRLISGAMSTLKRKLLMRLRGLA